MGIQSMPLRKEAEAIFMLANPNPTTCGIELTLESDALGLTLEGDSKEEVVIRANTSLGAGSHRVVAQINMPGTTQLPVVLSAGGLGSIEGEMRISLRVTATGYPGAQTSEWLIQPKGNEVVVAVVDAAHLKNSAFCLVPVYHHLEALDGAASTTAFRVVASEPTRVEGYAPDGTLLFVDAQGNGSFRDPGDLIATAAVDELFPVLKMDGGSCRIGLRYQPHSRDKTERVELRIETRMPGGESNWKATPLTGWNVRSGSFRMASG